MTGKGPFWGSIAMARLTLGPSFPPRPAGQPVFTCNLCRSLPQPTIPAGGTEMSPTRDVASVLQGSPPDPSGLTHCPRGQLGVLWARHQQILEQQADMLCWEQVLVHQGKVIAWSSSNLKLLGHKFIPYMCNFHHAPKSCEHPYQQHSLVLRTAAKSSRSQIIQVTMPASLTLKSGKTVLQTKKSGPFAQLATASATAGPDMVELSSGLVFLVSVTLIFCVSFSDFCSRCTLYLV